MGQEVRDPVLVDWQFPLVSVFQQTMAGQITEVDYWYAAMGNTVGVLTPGTTLSLVVGTALVLYIKWVNSGGMSITGHVDLVLYKPDGTSVSPAVYSGVQDDVEPPGYGAVVGFQGVTLDQVGSWTGRAILTGTQV